MLDNTKTPDLAGLRPLSERERQQRAESMACLDPAKKPGTPDCSQSLWMSLFFDGTGNNQDEDLPKSMHSNIVRLFTSHEDVDDSIGWYRIYIAGIGTKFPEIGEPGPSKLGLATGAGGDKRLQWARSQFDKRVSAAKARAKNPKQPIRMINVALFGFSRGAALARAFAIRLAKDCKEDGDGWRYQGHPIRLYFMGIFDTVASVGVSAGAKVLDSSPVLESTAFPMPSSDFSTALAGVSKDGHYDWASDLKIPKMVEQCVHYVAAHEVRDSFPLDSVRDGKHYPPNCFEVVYPGVHTDVGGGYAPGEQTRALEDNEKLSQVPLLHMYRAARAAGVPLRSLDGVGAKVKAYFELSPKTVALYDNYQKRTHASGPIETAVAEHLRQLYIARSFLANTGDAAAHSRLPWTDAVLKESGNDEKIPEQDKQLKLITAGGLGISKAMSYAAAKRKEGKTLTLRECALASAYENAIVEKDCTDEERALIQFFDNLVHDSVAGFGLDFSALQNWRITYFGDVSYVPDRRFAQADDDHLYDAEAIA